jgi:hypothetical protein
MAEAKTLRSDRRVKDTADEGEAGTKVGASAGERPPLRVGVLSAHDLRDPNAFSGIPYTAFHALRRAGVEPVDLSVHAEPPQASSARRMLAQARPMRPVKRWWRKAKVLKRNLAGWLSQPWDYQTIISDARSLSGAAQEMVDSVDLDAVLGVSVSSMIFELETELPVVYASDSTARLLLSTYPQYRNKSEGYRRARDEIEGQALRRCTFFAAAAKRTADSAVRHYGADPQRVGVVEFGAHVLPSTAPVKPDPPDGALEMVLVASDPVRKRLSLCIQVAECLREMGWDAVLNYVGPDHGSVRSNPAVKWHGRLMLGNPEDRHKHEELLSRSHWMLLPSTAEAFGIAPCEAAHFGRPSAVSDVGGLSTVVVHGETGLVLPMNADGRRYAEAINAVSSDPEEYARFSAASLRRAREVLSWDVWALRIKQIMVEALQGEDARQRAST